MVFLFACPVGRAGGAERFNRAGGLSRQPALRYVARPMANPTAGDLDALLDQPGLPAIIVHGGAGTPIHEDPAPYLAGTARAAEAGLRVLLAGGSALDAAQAATLVLEDDPTFNAGTGACLTSAGDCELDASCMDGTTLQAGGVASVKTVKNPILLARRVCDDTPHVLLAGPAAKRFDCASNSQSMQAAYACVARIRSD